MKRSDVHRFSFIERVVHWLVGITFVFLLLTGLAFSHPSLFWITTLVGGGPAARILHPWIGIVYSAGLIAMVALWIREMGIGREDLGWLKAVRHYAVHDKEKVPPVGKYNPGQKLFFWFMGAIGVVHLVSGIPLWFPDGVLGLGPFYGSPANVLRLLHYGTTVAGGLLLIVHVYLGTLAFPGTARGMLHGSVSPAWARHHHPLWDPESGAGAGEHSAVGEHTNAGSLRSKAGSPPPS